MLDIENVRSLIYNRKGYNIGFKVRVPSKVHELIEELCAFANVNGGYLFIGEDNNEKVIGTNFENNKRSAIQGSIRETPLTIFKKKHHKCSIPPWLLRTRSHHYDRDVR